MAKIFRTDEVLKEIANSHFKRESTIKQKGDACF